MAFYVISVRQTGDLPVVSLFPHPASFRFHLAMDTLTFGYILPTTGRIQLAQSYVRMLIQSMDSGTRIMIAGEVEELEGM